MTAEAGIIEAIVASFTAKVFAMPLRVLQTSPRSRDDFVLRFELFFEQTRWSGQDLIGDAAYRTAWVRSNAHLFLFALSSQEPCRPEGFSE